MTAEERLAWAREVTAGQPADIELHLDDLVALLADDSPLDDGRPVGMRVAGLVRRLADPETSSGPPGVLRRHPIEPVLDLDPLGRRAAQAIITTGGGPVVVGGEIRLRLFFPIATSHAAELSAADWRLTSPRLPVSGEISVAAPSPAIASRWGRRTGETGGLLCFTDVRATEELRAVVRSEARVVDDRVELDAASVWPVVRSESVDDTVDVCAGFTTAGGPPPFWLPWFDRSGLERLHLEFGATTATAIDRILAGTTRHYELRRASDVDWTRTWLRSATLPVAAQSNGDLGRLDALITLMGRDLRDLRH